MLFHLNSNNPTDLKTRLRVRRALASTCFYQARRTFDQETIVMVISLINFNLQINFLIGFRGYIAIAEWTKFLMKGETSENKLRKCNIFEILIYQSSLLSALSKMRAKSAEISAHSDNYKNDVVVTVTLSHLSTTYPLRFRDRDYMTGNVFLVG